MMTYTWFKEMLQWSWTDFVAYSVMAHVLRLPEVSFTDRIRHPGLHIGTPGKLNMLMTEPLAQFLI